MKPRAAAARLLAGMARALCLVLLLCPAACFSLKVVLPDDPQEAVSTLAIVTADPGLLDLEKPLEDQAPDQEAAALHALIKVLNVDRPLVLQWHWYSPENLRVRRSRSVTANAAGRPLAYVAAWDTLPQKSFAGKAGTWTVVITANDSLLARKEFILK